MLNKEIGNVVKSFFPSLSTVVWTFEATIVIQPDIIWKSISIGLDKNTPQAINKAIIVLQEKINLRLNIDPKKLNLSFGELYEEWFQYYRVQNKRTSLIKVPFYMDKHVFPIIQKI